MAAATASKTASITAGTFNLIENTNFNFYIDHNNTASTVKLNINGIGDKELKHYKNGENANVGTNLKKGHYLCRVAADKKAYQVIAGPIDYYKAVLGL